MLLSAGLQFWCTVMRFRRLQHTLAWQFASLTFALTTAGGRVGRGPGQQPEDLAAGGLPGAGAGSGCGPDVPQAQEGVRRPCLKVCAALPEQGFPRVRWSPPAAAGSYHAREDMWKFTCFWWAYSAIGGAVAFLCATFVLPITAGGWVGCRRGVGGVGGWPRERSSQVVDSVSAVCASPSFLLLRLPHSRQHRASPVGRRSGRHR